MSSHTKLRRPYHAGSVLGPAPKQSITSKGQVDWLTRVRAYWPRSNAKAGDVARALVGFIGPDGCCFPCLKSVARVASCSIKTAQHWISEFVGMNFLGKITRRDLFGQTSNAYLFLDPEAAEQSLREPSLPDSAKPPIYRKQEDSTAALSMEGLHPPSAPEPEETRAAAIRRVFGWLRSPLWGATPGPQPPRFTPEQQIALLRGT